MGVVCISGSFHGANEWIVNVRYGVFKGSDNLLLHKVQELTSKANDVQADQRRDAEVVQCGAM